MAAKKKRKTRPPSPTPLSADAFRLLDAVLASPEDVEARLVFADWLTEHGDPRGEFIQLQCALNRPLEDARGRAWKRPALEGDPTELMKRERKLLGLHQKAWVAPFREVIRTWNWSHGFVEKVVADAGTFLEGSALLFSSTPLLELKLTALEAPMLAQLGTQPTTAKLRSLDVSFNKLDASALEALRAPAFSGLRALNLAGNRFEEAGAAVLATLPLPSLEKLTLNDAKLTDRAFEVLANGPFVRRLRSLELGWNLLSSQVCHVLRASAPQLTWLSLAQLELDETAMRALAELPELRTLRVRPGTKEAVAAVLGARVQIVD